MLRVSLQGENHGERSQFAPQRIEREAERFERERAQQDAVAFFAEDDVRAANAVAILEERNGRSSIVTKENVAAAGTRV